VRAAGASSWESTLRSPGGLCRRTQPRHATGGSARFASPLNVWDFVHIVSLIALDPATAAQIGPAAAQIATAEA